MVRTARMPAAIPAEVAPDPEPEIEAPEDIDCDEDFNHLQSDNIGALIGGDTITISDAEGLVGMNADIVRQMQAMVRKSVARSRACGTMMYRTLHGST
jgi:hypothetical protein